jgi:SAM-dependent methyltransferase
MAEVKSNDQTDRGAGAPPSYVREAVRVRYAETARSMDLAPGLDSGRSEEGCGCSATSCCGPAEVWGEKLYGDESRNAAPESAFLASLGCGNPTAVAELHEGEVVLDLGSGAGLDVLLSARRVGPKGRVFGLDMTDEMLVRALENKARSGATNVEFLKGYIEEIPLPAASVDVVISNCVINLSPDKPRVFAEMHRVIRPGGRIGITDVVSNRAIGTSADDGAFDVESWSACIAGALTRDEYRKALVEAGFIDVELIDSHPVADGFVSAIIRARKPNDRGSQGGEI